MLTVWEAIKMRRSIRKFTPDNVPDELIEQMLEAARLAPSGHNRQPWRFLVVRNQQQKDELCRMCRGQRFIQEAPVVIVCFGDLNRYSLMASRQVHHELVELGVTDGQSSYLLEAGQSPAEGMSAMSLQDALIHLKANSYIAIEHLVLMAAALGLGTCWVSRVSGRADVNHLFSLADNLVPVALVALGYPAGELPPPRPRLSLEEIVLKP
ncbi:MAG: nitroreductase family protein [Dehalococcoidales bacterium]|nr:nitroreductase family protein [Dehalococcoidales bacterium]